MITPTLPMTIEVFEQLMLSHPDYTDRLFELIDGELVEKMTSEEHGLIVINIGTALRNYLKLHPIGRIGTEISHRLGGDDLNERRPDLSLMLDQERSLITQGAVPKMPDLAVEVKSYGNTYKALREKAAFYLAHGTRLVWLVYPEKALVEIYTPDQDSVILNNTDTLTGGTLLPDFTLPVREIFEF